jgi:hypothetical protein
MKKFMLKPCYIIFAVLFFYSCKKDSSSDCIDDTYSYHFYSSKKIDTTTTNAGLSFQVNPGNDLVFSYIHNGPECKNIADEEYTDRLVFEVATSSTSFLFQNGQLTDAMCLFVKYGFLKTPALLIDSGSIKGTKISDTKWDIEIDVEIGGSVGRIMLKKTFILR